MANHAIGQDALVGQHLDIDIDEAVPFVLVIAGDAGTDRQLVTDMRGGKMLQSAADMHPWTENDVVVQRPIAGSRNDDRVGEALFQVVMLHDLSHLPPELQQAYNEGAFRALIERLRA